MTGQHKITRFSQRLSQIHVQIRFISLIPIDLFHVFCFITPESVYTRYDPFVSYPRVVQKQLWSLNVTDSNEMSHASCLQLQKQDLLVSLSHQWFLCILSVRLAVFNSMKLLSCISSVFHVIRMSDYFKLNTCTSFHLQTFRYIITIKLLNHPLYFINYLALNCIRHLLFKTSLTFKCLIEHQLADFSYSRPLDTYLWKQMMKMNRNITYKWCNIAKKHLLFTKRKCHKFSWLFTASRYSPRRRSICACRTACKVLVSIGLLSLSFSFLKKGFFLGKPYPEIRWPSPVPFYKHGFPRRKSFF